MAPFPVSRMGFYEASFTKIRCHVQFKGLLSIEKKCSLFGKIAYSTVYVLVQSL